MENNNININPNNIIDIANTSVSQSEDKKQVDIGISDITDFSDLENTDQKEEKDSSTAIEENKTVLPQGGEIINEYIVDDTEKELFFGKSNLLTENNDTKITGLFDLVDKFKKMGEWIDIYLPMSNVVARIYEFYNDLFINEAVPPFIDDLLVAERALPDATHDRILLNKIFENTVILSKDSKEINNFDLEKLSNNDMNLLLLGAAKLLLISDPNVKDKVNIKVDAKCAKCGRVSKNTINIDDLIKGQYTKEMLLYAQNNYVASDTFEANFNRSLHIKYRKKGARYTRDGKNAFLVICKDPNYAESVAKENAAIRYLIRTYENYPIVEDFINTVEYKSSSNKKKLHDLVQTIVDSPTGSVYAASIETDMQNLSKLMYIDSIITGTIDENGKLTSTIEKLSTSDTQMEILFNAMKVLPKELKDKIGQIIEEMEKNTIGAKIIYKFSCPNPKCNHLNEMELDSRALTFIILQSLSSTSEENILQP